MDYEEKNNISSDELAILKPLKDILEYMNQFQLLPKTLSEPEKILELRKLLRVSSLSVARADEFARDILLDKNAYKNFLNEDDFSESAVKKFAANQNVLSCIVTGRLQSDGIIGWDCLPSTLRYYKWLET